MKVVINVDYGGFGLSHKAIMRYAELKGITLYSWLEDFIIENYGKDILKKSWEEIEKVVPYISYTRVPREEYKKVYRECSNKGDFTESNSLYFSDTDIERNDPILVQVVEELGEEANGKHATLKVVEIPDDIEWYIEEYDGCERVAEKHRTWE